jgi:gliding motility-associated-like protein
MNTFRKAILFLILLLSSIVAVSAQETVEIVGETEVCVEGCFEYRILADSIEFSEWVVTGPNGFVYTGDPDFPDQILICFELPGTYLIEVYGFDDLQGQYYGQLVVIVFDFAPAEIISTASQYCPTDSISGSCEKVCEGAIIDYLINEGGGNPSGVSWTVSGAESYEVNSGGTLTVTWGGAGFGLIQANVSPDVPGCEKSSTLCVEIIELPVAAFETMPPATGNNVTICRGQTIYIDNQTTGATDYEWQVSNGFSSTDPNPTLDFPIEGIYTLNYIARNECGCADSLSLIIEVLEGQSPFVDCVGTICENETAEYSSDADCTQFVWSTSANGSIVDGGALADDFIVVDWGAGPEGWIYLETDNCNGDFCNEPAMIRIPIISDNALIEGPDRVCKASLENYEIADYEGTGYIWTVSPGNMIVSGQGTNQISVQWKVNTALPSYERVIVEYENCYLECSGKDTLEVLITDEYFVEGPFEVCPNSTSIFNTRKVSNIADGVPANWEIFGPNGMLYWSSTSTIDEINIVWPNAPGLYMVKATPGTAGEFCNEQYQITVNLSQQETAPTNIIGEFDICRGNAYEYEALSAKPNNIFTWYVEDGADEYTIQGNPVVITWNTSGPYSLEVSQADYSSFPCESDKAAEVLNPITNIQINGNNDACLEDVEVYTLGALNYVDIVWEVFPANAGTIISGQGSDEVEVQWNSLGNHEIRVASCMLNNSYNVTINSLPEPMVNHPLNLCEGELASISTTIAYNSYRWFDENENEVSSLQSPDLPAGYYQLEVTDVKGCRGYKSFNIEEYIKPEINISTPSFTTFCTGPPWPTLYALESDPPYSYQWYKDGLAVGGNTSIFSTDDFASYYVEISDINGCTNISNVINVTKNCGGGGGNNPGCTSSSGTIDFNFSLTPECNVIDFQNASNSYLPGSLTYYFGDPILGTSTLENPTFTFPSAGYHKVLLLGQVPDDANPGNYCLSGMLKIVEVPIAPDFDFEVECSGEVSSFENRSTFIPGESISSWSWDFGDPSSGADNTSNLEKPDHNFSTSGNFDITLTVSNGSCTATKTVIIYVPPSSTIDFNDPLINCESAAVPFEGLSPEFISQWSWDFGDPSSGDANTSNIKTPFHEFASPGNYTITVNGTNVYGCTSSLIKNIQIEANPLNGLLSYTSPVCEGETVTITSPGGGASWKWSTGETTDQIDVLESGLYYLTLTDNNGCSYSPPAGVVEILPNPASVIRAVEYDEYGQIIATSYDNYFSCFGEDITLLALDNANYSFVWSNGIIGNKLEFLDERGTLLDPGVYQFSVDVTDNTTLCTTEVGPFTITVHPNPMDIVITSNPAGYLCDGEVTSLEVQFQEAGVTYLWSNGMQGPDILVDMEGTYSVVGTNTFGCQTESNEIVVHSAPDIGKIPSGCLVRCKPDTICLPSIPNIASYQWFLDGTVIPGPEGQTDELIATEDGSYHVELTDVFGCTAVSDGFDLELLDGFGTIYGTVYYDLNDNGVVDAGDTLMENIEFYIEDTGGAVYNDISNKDGEFLFLDVLSTEYTVTLDTTSLPPATKPYFNDLISELIGCDDTTNVVFLIHEFCEPLNSVTDLKLCYGTTMDYNNITLSKDTSFQLDHLTTAGCDSVEMVNVELLDDVFFGISTNPACSGENNGIIEFDISSGGLAPFEYSLNGIDYYPGNSFENLAPGNYNVTIRDANGCSYEDQVDIDELENIEFEIQNKEIGCEENDVWNTFNLLSGDPSQFQITWSDGSTAGAINIFEPGSFWVELSNDCQTVRRNFTITFEQADLSSQMFVPNIFTPNGDGINDFMEPFLKNTNETVIELFQIFDRWGNVIYETDDSTPQWDGKFQGNMLNPGVYTWHIRARINACHNMEEIYKFGDVTLLR